MSDVAIRAEGLGKQYRLGQQESYKTLRDALARGATAPFRYARSALRPGYCSTAKPKSEPFWALKDVSFEVKQGEAVGIIGRNGSGKSTLLKILSRITDPTKGHAEIRGRVSSLLEVGTGFHPELTGRENVYLNGAILGMRKAEIDLKFDEIVAFAGVERFLDTPVKRYSSGMAVRLGFAVAAHTQPEVLLVDEVLAVGDAEFQKRCLGKLGSVAREGRTVLFVSHNMASIQRLCARGLVLNDGAILMDGPMDEVTRRYLRVQNPELGERIWADTAQAPGNDVVRLLAVRTKNRSGAVCSRFDVRDPVTIEINYCALKEGHQLCAVLELLDAMGQLIVVAFDSYTDGPWGKQSPCTPGFLRSTWLLPGHFLNEGDLSVNLRVFSPPLEPNAAPHLRELDVLRFSVTDGMDPGSVRGSFPYGWGLPAVRPRLHRFTERLPSEEACVKKE
jgi:lipopolysaccharide transport system ATP-binding protein